jgi:hypothetical protein
VSYDLVFWRQAGPIPAAADAIYKELIEGRRAVGLVDLNVESFLAAILAEFPGSVREPNGDGEWVDWTSDGGDRSFQVEWSPEHLVVFCRGTTNDEMNRLIDIGFAHGCRLYDPQVNERFD